MLSEDQSQERQTHTWNMVIPGIWSYLEYGTMPVKVNPSSFLSGGAPKYSILQIINLVLMGMMPVLVGVDHYFEQL